MHHFIHTTQVPTLFGGYVAEQHADTTHWNLARGEATKVILSRTPSMFEEVLASLRRPVASLRRYSGL
jgi:hypothetical protein